MGLILPTSGIYKFNCIEQESWVYNHDLPLPKHLRAYLQGSGNVASLDTLKHTVPT